MDYVIEARKHVNPTNPVNQPGSTIVSWMQGADECFLDTATKRFGVKVSATGELRTFHVSNELDKQGNFIGLLQWARNRNYPHPAFP